jgi:hypothetical protein
MPPRSIKPMKKQSGKSFQSKRIERIKTTGKHEEKKLRVEADENSDEDPNVWGSKGSSLDDDEEIDEDLKLKTNQSPKQIPTALAATTNSLSGDTKRS